MPSKKPADPVKDTKVPGEGDCPLDWRKAPEGGSTKVAIDGKNKVIYIETCMEFSGPDATEEYAAAAKKQIEETWSGKHTRDGKEYDVVTRINTKVNTTGTPTAGCDPITVDKSVGRMDQTLFGAGVGNQTPEAANDKGRPRRIAHEYGHTLGLDDEYEDDEDGNWKPKDGAKEGSVMLQTWPTGDGTLPHPLPEHYDEILKSHGW